MKLLKRKRSRPLLVSILGSGPAGLFAAQAAYDTGNIVQIFSRGERSQLYGAQYLHAPIPGLDCGKPEPVSYILKGTAEAYWQKVYGGGVRVEVSPEVLSPQHNAWNIRAAYAEVWERFRPLIRKQEITRSWLEVWGDIVAADLVVWSIPLEPLCLKGHAFRVQSIWAQGDAPDLNQFCSVAVDPWTIVTNGEESPRWYRASNVFGHRTAEWPDGPKPPVQGLAKVNKPIATNCDCWLDSALSPVLRVGRYGTWTKGELSHEAYVKTRAALEAM